ncbi:hypothetical protein IFM89_007730 [Coptis chinensis]|uniref:FACT complex subunit n=1 Tax=Coptis chinensis TaxID=261450 RepID=A0A835IXH1_9MAGN|nr:hypothetical protein IFM89_007730 [Coptis chinensis]
MNLKAFKKKLRVLYANWEKNNQDLWGSSEVLLISSSPISSSNTVSSRFYVWLLGYVFADTIAIFTLKEIHFICNRKHASQLKSLTSTAEEAVHAQLVVHVKAKGDDGDMIMDRVLSDLKLRQKCKYILLSYPKNKSECDEQNPSSPLIVGHVVGESPASKLLFSTSLKKKVNEFQTVDVKDRLSRFAPARVDNDVDENKEQQIPVREQVVWGFKYTEDDPGWLLDDWLLDDSTCRRRHSRRHSTKVEAVYSVDNDVDENKEQQQAEEKILLAEVEGRDDSTLRRRHNTKVEAVYSVDNDVDENKEQQVPVREQVVWGFKYTEDDPCWLLDDWLLDDSTCRRRHSTKVEAVYSVDNDVDENKEQQVPVREQGVWGFKYTEDDPGWLLDDSSERDGKICMQQAEEKILLAEVEGRDDSTLRRRHSTKVEAVYSVDNDVDENKEQQVPVREQVVSGFKYTEDDPGWLLDDWLLDDSSERDGKICMQPLSKEAEEKILLVEVKGQDDNDSTCRRRHSTKVEAVYSEATDATTGLDEASEWILV